MKYCNGLLLGVGTSTGHVGLNQTQQLSTESVTSMPWLFKRPLNFDYSTYCMKQLIRIHPFSGIVV